MNKFKNFFITPMLTILILLIGLFIFVNLNSKYNLKKLIEYSNTLTEFDCQDILTSNGYIDKDTALKIVATSKVEGFFNTTPAQKYLGGVTSVYIRLVDKQNERLKIQETYNYPVSNSAYWLILLSKNDNSYQEKALFNIDYYTGQVLYGNVLSSININ